MNGHCNNLEKDKHIPYVALKAHIDQYTSDCVFAANRFMRIPRLPLVIFPMIFQFISQKAKASHMTDSCEEYSFSRIPVPI